MISNEYVRWAIFLAYFVAIWGTLAGIAVILAVAVSRMLRDLLRRWLGVGD
jgi:hypothetical protein